MTKKRSEKEKRLKTKKQKINTEKGKEDSVAKVVRKACRNQAL